MKVDHLLVGEPTSHQHRNGGQDNFLNHERRTDPSKAQHNPQTYIYQRQLKTYIRMFPVPARCLRDIDICDIIRISKISQNGMNQNFSSDIIELI